MRRKRVECVTRILRCCYDGYHEDRLARRTVANHRLVKLDSAVFEIKKAVRYVDSRNLIGSYITKHIPDYETVQQRGLRPLSCPFTWNGESCASTLFGMAGED